MTKVRVQKATGSDLVELIERAQIQTPNAKVTEEGASNIEQYEHCFSGVDVFGKCWFVGGIFKQQNGAFEAWFILDPKPYKHLVSIVKIVKDKLKEHPAKEIEAWIDVNFDGGHRWITMLGFHQWVPLTVENRQGPNCVKYVLVKESGT